MPQGLNALKQVAKEVGLDLEGASLNLDGGFDSTRNRKCIFNAGINLLCRAQDDRRLGQIEKQDFRVFARLDVKRTLTFQRI